MFGGVIFNQYASDFDENWWNTCDTEVFGGVHFDQNASVFDEHSWVINTFYWIDNSAKNKSCPFSNVNYILFSLQEIVYQPTW